jgi:hypothetical protein
MKGFTHARLGCGCRITFREGVEGSPVTVVVEEKSPACLMTLHVRDLPLFDYREALRASTRPGPAGDEEFEEEG